MKNTPATEFYLKDMERKGKATTEAMKRLAKKAAKRTALGMLILAVLLACIVYALIAATGFYDSHTIIIKSPIEISVKTNRVMTVEDRITVVVVKPENVQKLIRESENPTLSEMICAKDWNCEVALAVARAESGMRCDAVNANTNGTVDLSLYQLNSSHMKKGGDWTLANMANCAKNIDLAYELWKVQGWNPWVAYTSGAYLAKL